MVKRKTKSKRVTLRQLQAQIDQLTDDKQSLVSTLWVTRGELRLALSAVAEAKALLGDSEQKREPLPTYEMGHNVGNALNDHEQRIASLEFRMREPR